MVDTKKIEEMLMDSTFEVFERMFYISIEPLNTNHIGGHIAAATIGFDGQSRGEVQLLLSRGFAEIMTQNMLSLSNTCEVTEKQIEDCAKEAVNMVCGNFLRKLDNEKGFNLSLPVFRRDLGGITYQGEGDLQGSAFALDFTSNGETMKVVMTMADRNYSDR